MSTLSTHLTRMVKSESWSRYLLPRQADVLFVALFAAVMVLGSRLLNMDGDLGRHLTIGNYILDELRIPTSDIFSHTMSGLGLTPHEWLSQVIFALAFRIAGLDGVVLLCALVIAGSFTLVFQQCLDRSGLLVISLETVFPVKVVDWMGEQPAAGPVFNYFPWNGYLLYRSWPEELVFIDRQTDFYGEDLTRQYERVITLGEGWQQVLEQHQVRQVIMPPDSKLVNQLKNMEGWAVVYADETAAILDSKP